MMPTDAEIAALTRDELASLLATYARYAPEDMLPDSQTWGHGTAVALWGKIRSLPLVAELPGIVDEMLLSNDYKLFWLGSTLATGSSVGLSVLERAIAWAPTQADLPAECLSNLRHDWAWAVKVRRIPWQNAMREQLLEAWAGPLLAAAMVQDHAYLLSHFAEILGPEPNRAIRRLSSAVEGTLGREEAVALQTEMRAHQGEWGETWTHGLLDAIQWYIDNNRLPSGPVRW